MLTYVNMFLHVLTCSYMFKHYECYTKYLSCIHRQMHIHFMLPSKFYSLYYVIFWALIHYPMYFICIYRTNDFAFVNHILNSFTTVLS